MSNVYQCTAYDVVKPVSNSAGVIYLSDGDNLALNQPYKGQNYLNHFQIGSVASYATENNNCPIEAIGRAKENKHDLWFIFSLGSCITSHKQARKTYIEVTHGDTIYFQGRIFLLEKAGNNNLHLSPRGLAESFPSAKLITS